MAFLQGAVLNGFFQELEKISSLAAAARFGAGVLLGSLLWNSLGGEEKEELKQKAESVTGEKQLPPIIIAMSAPQQSAVERELGKPDPSLYRLADLFKHPRDLELRGMLKGAAQDVPEEDKAQANKLFNRARKVATFGAKKPPDPNIRAVATKIPRPAM